MNRRIRIAIAIAALLIGLVIWRPGRPAPTGETGKQASVESPESPDISAPTPGDALLEGYGDPSTPPMEDLRKLHRVVTGYFSVIKDASHFPIGGNGDLAAALMGQNPNREVFVRPGHPVFSSGGLLTDRWQSAIIVHPEAWMQLELRSPGPDRIPYNGDDLILAPNGVSREAR